MTDPSNIRHLKDLTPDAHNRRKHNPRNIGMLVDALHKVGAARSIVIDEDGEVLAGNGVVEAAAEAGLTKVQVVDADGETIVAVRRTGLTAEQKTALAIYDNRTAEPAEWNPEQLRADQADGLDLKPYFSDGELAEIVGAEVKAGQTDPDAVPELRPTDIVRGDLFALGQHRLLCGDSTNAEDVAHVMGGEKAALIWTDPPYGVSYRGGAKERDAITNDETTEAAVAAIRLGAAVVQPGASIYVAVAARPRLNAECVSGFIAAGYHVAMTLAWVKDSFAGGWGDYRGQWEPILYGWRDDAAHRWFGGRDASTVFSVGRPTRSESHPTMKPVELVRPCLANSSLTGETVYEPFSGSGTTLIACEQLNRRCFAIEIEPSYVQVAIDRWEAFTGQKAVKL